MSPVEMRVERKGEHAEAPAGPIDSIYLGQLEPHFA